MTLPLGKHAVWSISSKFPPEAAVEVEQLGYHTIWLGANPGAELELVEPMLAATRTMTIGTSIVNIWMEPAKAVAESFHRIEAAYPGRFILGIGAGHREATQEYHKPYDALVAYLDELDEAGVPEGRRALAALGPRVLRLARERSAGALPYLVTPQHTRRAREILGPTSLLAVEQKVVVVDDPQRARELAAPRVGYYLRLSNYVSNLRRLGFTEQDVTGPGSDRLLDELAVHGTPQQVARQVDAHLTAGADQVAVQVISADGDIMPTLRELARVWA